MSNMSVHFSSANQEWGTPQDLFLALDKEFRFELDAAATSSNTKCKVYFDKTSNGLEQDWSTYGTVWVNPPYGRGVTGKWVKKAYEEAQKGCTVVMLLPSRTDTIYFHTWIMKGEIRFLKGRLKFEGAKDSAPFPSMIVVFRKI
jgi:phage N-6-adenine-methyltransferase